MKTKGISIGLVVFLALAAARLSVAQVSGSFRGVLYTSEFYLDPGLPTKEISAETNLVFFPSSNQIAVAYGEWSTARAISESGSEPDGEEVRYRSHCSVSNWYEGEDADDGDGNPVVWNPYLRAQLSPSDDGVFSIYFDSNTNVAFVLGHEIDDSEHNQGKENFGVMVRRGTGLDNSILNGRYVGFGIGGHFGGDSECGQGNIESYSFFQREAIFDGNGHWQGSKSREVKNLAFSNVELMTNGDTLVFTLAELTNATNSSSEATNSTYSVSSDGYVLLTNDASGEVETFFASPDGEVLASIDVDSNSACRLIIALRTPENMTMDDLAGRTYTGEIMTDELAGADGESRVFKASIGQELIYISFLSNGIFTLRQDSWTACNILTNLVEMQDGNLICTNRIHTDLPRRIISPAEQGTYTVSSNGIVSLDFGNGDTGMLQVSSNGQFAASGYINADPRSGEMERGLIVAVLRNPPPEASSPVALDPVLSFSSTGMCFSVSAPANTPFEILCTANLMDHEWSSVGTYTNQADGPVRILDSESADARFRCYRASTLPW